MKASNGSIHSDLVLSGRGAGGCAWTSLEFGPRKGNWAESHENAVCVLLITSLPPAENIVYVSSVYIVVLWYIFTI